MRLGLLPHTDSPAQPSLTPELPGGLCKIGVPGPHRRYSVQGWGLDIGIVQNLLGDSEPGYTNPPLSSRPGLLGTERIDRPRPSFKTSHVWGYGPPFQLLYVCLCLSKSSWKGLLS